MSVKRREVVAIMGPSGCGKTTVLNVLSVPDEISRGRVILEGVVYIESQGKPEAVLSAGDSFYQPPGEWHIISTGAEGAKTVVFRVLERDQDPVVDVE